MAGWFGPTGDCGCGCATCECPEGGTSKVFTKKPTVRTVISGLPAFYSFDSTSPAFGTRTYSTTTITGMDAANGTYFWELPKVGNCINYQTVPNAIIPFSQSFALDFFVTARTLSGSTGCTVASSSVHTFQANLLVGGSRLASIGVAVGASTAQLLHPDSSMQYGEILVEVTSSSRLECALDYDPSLTEATMARGIRFVSKTVNLSDQKIYITHYPVLISACASIVDNILVEIGTITSELLNLD